MVTTYSQLTSSNLDSKCGYERKCAGAAVDVGATAGQPAHGLDRVERSTGTVCHPIPSVAPPLASAPAPSPSTQTYCTLFDLFPLGLLWFNSIGFRATL
jgi:hypothetical protein